MYVVITTVEKVGDAKRFARRLVEEKLAACVSVLPGVNSTYWWRGKVERAREVMLLAKTTRGKMKRLVQRVEELHPYEIPEILSIPVGVAPKKYLEWMRKSLERKTTRSLAKDQNR